MQQRFSNSEDLIDEITRYLAAVDLFRAERCEPTWRPELVPSAVAAPAPTEVEQVPSAH